MLDASAYLCDSRKCKNCTFPKCSHMTGKPYKYRCPDEIELRMTGTMNDNNYYISYNKRPVLKGE